MVVTRLLWTGLKVIVDLGKRQHLNYKSSFNEVLFSAIEHYYHSKQQYTQDKDFHVLRYKIALYNTRWSFPYDFLFFWTL
jgi:hypothetical protein